MQVVYSGRFNGRRPEKLRAVNGEMKPGKREYLHASAENFGIHRVKGPEPGTESGFCGWGLGWTDRGAFGTTGVCSDSHPQPADHE